MSLFTKFTDSLRTLWQALWFDYPNSLKAHSSMVKMGNLKYTFLDPMEFFVQ